MLSEKNNNIKGKKWPDYIEKAIKHNKKIKENKIFPIKVSKETLNERMKRGSESIKDNESELINIKNLKIAFRKSTSNYKLSKDNKLLYVTKTKKLNIKFQL